MRLIKNSGNDRVIDELRKSLPAGSQLSIASSHFSLFAFAELRERLARGKQCRLVMPALDSANIQLLGTDSDRLARNRLQNRWLAAQCMAWLKAKAEVRLAASPLPQAALVTEGVTPVANHVITGNCSFTTEGLGLAPNAPFSLIQCSETDEEWQLLNGWFANLWSGLPRSDAGSKALLAKLGEIADHRPPFHVYLMILHHLFRDLGEELDEERIIRSATGIRDTVVWRKLYKFQRDGVFGAIDKLERFGGCIIADSVGLGKTFEALAVIKYFELRNDRVLVLCPKRLRDNWTLYKANDRRNILSADRFNYDVLNHTDLSRDGGLSGELDLSYINWGNYDLVVIDESHNFRNKPTHKGRESRYERLMQRVIKAGVRTRVLMLSATPVNNRLADLKNQIAFITEGNDGAFVDQGIPSIEATIRLAQTQFNKWLDLPNAGRRQDMLTEMLGFDYFKLLDMLTIARSRKHVEKYYGTAETGKFPERLTPRNIKADVDSSGRFPPVREINDDIRRLNLAAYAPLRYLLPGRLAAYEAKYDTQVRGGQGRFRQVDREESMVHLIRVNLLKRMESSVHAFALTLERQLTQVDGLLEKLDSHIQDVEALSIDEVDVDDPTFETLLIGTKVKVLLQDVDAIRWRQELEDDHDRLARLHAEATQVGYERDAKLAELKALIADKVENPLNPGNRKMIIFTAFADTAEYLYRDLSVWVRAQYGIESAQVTGAGGNKCTLKKIRSDLGGILSSFSPRSKERPEEMAQEGELDLLIATDCISEGQNLQDCDTLVNYDIHWNPVRIIQRFGRIDRIGSPNARIQLVNFWPNMELDEYINLEQRVSGRMVLLDISATGEENVIEHQSGDQMNDLEYRRKQLLKLQEAVIDMEEIEGGISITDMTLNDFRMDLAGFQRGGGVELERMPLGSMAVASSLGLGDSIVPPGVIFCLRAEAGAARDGIDGKSGPEPGYPLSPHYLVHVGEDGAVLLPFTQAKRILDRLRKVALERTDVDAAICERFDRASKGGREMGLWQDLLAKGVGSILGKKEERAMASLFSPGGTHAMQGEFSGIYDFEVVAWLAILPEDGETTA
ncbi:helicase domain protein [Magnetococcus marinus MC-1]|uniref:Helicase domain protein n=1 Tax=Magnetococcus marinus (strain ATCC BAA-1437 / JCM 17883 / MC-1) TaxID=156889 RepID=A0L5R1_MAGMM|nr:helicase-related protein [Magnetococcus marinus]ABK43304.1 helicase domain protein [Magnetococcus marinus MC-1]